MEEKSVKERVQARGEREWWAEREREDCVRTEASAKKNKSPQFTKLNSTELSLGTEMDRVREERLARVE